MTPAILARDLDTRHGIYPAGTTITVLGRRGRTGRWNVCLDPNGVHLTRRCHVVALPDAALARQVDPPPERATAEQERELFAELRRYCPPRSAA